MIVYRDMAFCSRQDCTNEKCRRLLTKDVRNRAAAEGLPLSVSDFGPVCKDYRREYGSGEALE